VWENNIKSIIEALLFSSEKPLTIEQVKKVLDHLEATQVRKNIEELKLEYEQANRGLRIAEVAGGFQMMTSPRFAPFLKKLYKERHIERLSKPALLTLAIIAYKQPVTKRQIQSLRGVSIDGVMNNLLDKSLIRITGRKKAPGRPYVFGTTLQFLEYFGLNSLEELPKIEEFPDFVEQRGVEQAEEIREIPEGADGPKKPAQEN
jgi:segregation and condensation protein B